MNIVKTIMVLAVFAILFTSAGCGKAGEPVSSELRQQILDAGNNLSSYRMEGTTTVNGGGKNKFSMTADFSGECDVADMNLSMKTDISMAAPKVSADSSQKSEIYLFSDVLYKEERSTVACMQWEIDGKPTGWMSTAMPYMDMPSADWGDNNQFKQQLDLMSNTEIRHAGSETVRGIDCYVFEISTGKAQLINAILKQPGIGYLLDGIDATELSGMIDMLTMREWISKDTNLLIKAETGMRLNMAGDPVDVLMSMSFYDHNLPLDITLPADCPVWPPPAEEVWTAWNMAQS